MKTVKRVGFPRIEIHVLGTLAMVLLCTMGCVRRRMTVRTNPVGAMVYVDRQPLGKTPVSHSFTYYGTRHFEIVKDGYRTEEFLRTFNPPWYQLPPLDFISETLWPYERRDERIIDVQMTPQTSVPTDALIISAEGLRLQAGQGMAVVSSPSPVGAPPAIGYPAPPINERYIDPTLPGGANSTTRILPQPNAGGAGSILPGQAPNRNPSGLYLPDLLQPPASNPAMNITPGGSYRQPLENGGGNGPGPT